MSVRPEEAQVRKQIDAFMESSGGLREYDRFVLSLCHSWLAQGRVIEAARVVLHEFVLWAEDANDGEFAIWSRDHFMGAFHELQLAFNALAAGGETETP